MNLFSILFPLISLVSIVNGYSYVPELNLTQYEGTWFEVYKDLFDETFQKGGTCVTATYKLLDNGTVSVFNSQVSLSGKQENITGSAYYEDGNYGGDLTVYLDGTIAAPYWVIGLGPIVNGYYDYAIVSDDKQISLFVLALFKSLLLIQMPHSSTVGDELFTISVAPVKFPPDALKIV